MRRDLAEFYSFYSQVELGKEAYGITGSRGDELIVAI